MGVDIFLSRLDKVRRTGRDSWIACCPAHDDKHPSLSIREKDDGKPLLHCFAGCSNEEILAALGLDASVLLPRAALAHRMPSERRPFPAADVLRCIAFEALVVLSSGVSMLSGEFRADERERLVLAVGRIQSALDAAGVSS
jgi:hypothetical protein